MAPVPLHPRLQGDGEDLGKVRVTPRRYNGRGRTNGTLKSRTAPALAILGLHSNGVLGSSGSAYYPIPLIHFSRRGLPSMVRKFSGISVNQVQGKAQQWSGLHQNRQALPSSGERLVQ